MRSIYTGLLIVFGLGLIAPATNATEVFRLSTVLTQNGYDAAKLFRTGDNHLFIFGKLNGRRRSFLVDTGWSFTTAGTNAARHLAAKTDATVFGDFVLGNLTFTNQSVKLQDVRFNGQPAPFDVVLGLDFFRHHYAILDCAGQRLYLRRNKPTNEQEKNLEIALRRAGFHALELRLKAPPAITALALLNGQPVEMLVDSGAAWSCIDGRQCERLGLKPLPSMTRISGAGKTGIRSVAVAQTKTFQLGDVTVKNANFALFDLADLGFAAPGKTLSEVQGILGGEMLATSSAVIDCHALKLWPKTSRAK